MSPLSNSTTLTTHLLGVPSAGVTQPFFWLASLSSSVVSLYASKLLCPCSINTLYCALNAAWIKPIIKECYDSVSNGKEIKDVIDANSNKEHREKINKLIYKMSREDIWITKKKINAMKNNKSLIGL